MIKTIGNFLVRVDNLIASLSTLSRTPIRIIQQDPAGAPPQAPGPAQPRSKPCSAWEAIGPMLDSVQAAPNEEITLLGRRVIVSEYDRRLLAAIQRFATTFEKVTGEADRVKNPIPMSEMLASKGLQSPISATDVVGSGG